MSDKVEITSASSVKLSTDKRDSAESILNSNETTPKSSQSETEKNEFPIYYNSNFSKVPSKQRRFRNAWGNLSYANLIAAAILSSPKQKMKLNEIYSWFVTNIPYFAVRDDEVKSRGWKNSIRHNLSLKREFQRESGDKKAGYWCIDKDLFLQRLHSENRQINDPIYNQDMEIFESFVSRAFNYNEKLKHRKEQILLESKMNLFFPAESIKYPVKPFNLDTNLIAQPIEFSIPKSTDIQKIQGYDQKPTSHLSKPNPFQISNSSTTPNYNNSINYSNSHSLNSIENYVIYSVADTSIPATTQIIGINNLQDNSNVSQFIYSQDFSYNQPYYSNLSYAVPIPDMNGISDQSFNPAVYQTIDYSYSNLLNNRTFNNNYPMIINNNNPFPQDLTYPNNLKNENLKPLVNL